MCLTRKITLFFLMLAGNILPAQGTVKDESFGKVLNGSVGVAYYRYVGYYIPAAVLDFEFQLDKNLTAAPFIILYAYQSNYVWADKNNTPKSYHYYETVIPVGIKVSYYFDEILKARPNWDFYTSASLGFIYRKTTWEAAYMGKNQINPGTGPVFIDFQLGTEFHLRKSVGLQMAISTGILTLGLAVHFP